MNLTKYLTVASFLVALVPHVTGSGRLPAREVGSDRSAAGPEIGSSVDRSRRGSTAPSSAAPPPQILTDTDAGRVGGLRLDGVTAFLRIPFAAPPVGRLRWKPPRPVPRWRGTLSAANYGPSCPQAISPSGFGPWTPEYVARGAVDEDCLSLNIWTPAPAVAKRLPVLVWIHGGAFVSGSGSVPIYDGAPLARQGIVVVSINYRLGVLGFLGSKDFRKDGGNFGLQDQIAALRWLKRNIAYFGGDPRRVTVAGQSAGAISIHALMLSPRARGLFQGAIPQSGIGLGFRPELAFARRDQAERGAAALFEAAGVRSIAEARGLSIQQLDAALGKASVRPDMRDVMRPSPYADGVILPIDPGKALAAGRYNDVPVMIGLTADEGSGLSSSYRVADPIRYRTLIERRVGPLASEFLKLYPATSPKSSFPAFTRDGGVLSTIEWIMKRSEHSRFPAYGYIWTHVEPGPLSAKWGAFHTSEVPYTLGTLDKSPERNFTAEDRRVQRIVSSYWINFVKRGDPNAPGLPVWRPFRSDGDLLELGNSFERHPALDPHAVELFRMHLANGGSLLAM